MPKIAKNYVVFSRFENNDNKYLLIQDGYRYFISDIKGSSRFTHIQAMKIKNDLNKENRSHCLVYGYFQLLP